jgi:uncharacterized protein (DUF305 family)
VSSAIALALALGGAAAAQHEEHVETAPRSGPVLYNAEDLEFLRHMIVHHEQALAMCALVPERTERPELERFARYIEGAQAAEIAMMQGLLDMAAERGLVAPGHDHGLDADPPMAGMLSTAEMDTLAEASGADFERLWLVGMIFHHEGGLAMARAQELQQAHYGRRPHGLEVLVEEILIVQRAEITKMQAWLDAWGLGPSTNERKPAAETTSPASGATLAVGEPAQLFGLAVDDGRVAEVLASLQDLRTEEWLQEDGEWAPRVRLMHGAEVTQSGPRGAAWAFSFTPPAPGRYLLAVQAVDAAGTFGASSERELFAE